MWSKLGQSIVCRLLTTVFIFVTSYLLLVTSALAAEEFSTSYDVAYDVQSSGTTQVTQRITLKNLTSQYYVSNFTLTIGSTEISEVNAADDGGSMEIKLEKKESKTAITARFNGQVAGLGKTQTFTLKFKSKDFAQALGKTWEVNLPKIPQASQVERYNLVLSVPVAFGDPTSISPQPKGESSSFERLFFTFDKSQLEKSGVSVNFGTTQVFDFQIKYPLKNNSLFPVLTSITLPPDTRYQDIFISSLDPQPLNVVIDGDGNYLAWYRLPRGADFEVNLNGSAKLYIRPKDQSGSSYQKPATLSDQESKLYTQADKYWESNSPAISSTLNQIFKEQTPGSNREKARLIYLWVVGNLNYNTSRLDNNDIGRLGALTALSNSSVAVCMEFTDLFIALARAAGVPARELDGFAYTQNQTLRPLSLAKDLLHAWPEYWDLEQGWVMVDPTWENTSGGVDYFHKFDLNHLVLAIKGSSSQSPYVSDNVTVSLAQGDFIPKSQIELSLDLPESIWSPFPQSLRVKIKNLGGSVQSPTGLSLKPGQLQLKQSSEVSLGRIPPLGFTEVEYDLKVPLFGPSFESLVEAQVAGQKVSKVVVVNPLFSNQTYPYLLAGVAVLAGSIYGSILLTHYLKRRSLYRKFR